MSNYWSDTSSFENSIRQYEEWIAQCKSRLSQGSSSGDDMDREDIKRYQNEILKIREMIRNMKS